MRSVQAHRPLDCEMGPSASQRTLLSSPESCGEEEEVAAALEAAAHQHHVLHVPGGLHVQQERVCRAWRATAAGVGFRCALCSLRVALARLVGAHGSPQSSTAFSTECAKKEPIAGAPGLVVSLQGKCWGAREAQDSEGGPVSGPSYMSERLSWPSLLLTSEIQSLGDDIHMLLHSTGTPASPP